MPTYWNSNRDDYPRDPADFLTDDSLDEAEDLTPFEIGARHVRESVDLNTEEAIDLLQGAEDLAEARETFAVAVLKNLQFHNTIGLISPMREYLESRDGPVPTSYRNGVKAAARALFTACAPTSEIGEADVRAEDLPTSVADPFTLRNALA
jgi:hypothetical protein